MIKTKTTAANVDRLKKELAQLPPHVLSDLQGFIRGVINAAAVIQRGKRESK